MIDSGIADHPGVASRVIYSKRLHRGRARWGCLRARHARRRNHRGLRPRAVRTSAAEHVGMAPGAQLVSLAGAGRGRLRLRLGRHRGDRLDDSESPQLRHPHRQSLARPSGERLATWTTRSPAPSNARSRRASSSSRPPATSASSRTARRSSAASSRRATRRARSRWARSTRANTVERSDDGIATYSSRGPVGTPEDPSGVGAEAGPRRAGQRDCGRGRRGQLSLEQLPVPTFVRREWSNVPDAVGIEHGDRGRLRRGGADARGESGVSILTK